MIGAAELRRMKPTALLVNAARAEIVVEEDLFEALKAGTIGGAVLDAWYRYPTSASGHRDALALSLRDAPQCAHHAAFGGVDRRRLGAPLRLLCGEHRPACGRRASRQHCAAADDGGCPQSHVKREKPCLS